MLQQIRESIHNLELWNEPYTDLNEMLASPDGVKTLAANCMLIEAIGEGFKRIDERTEEQLLQFRPAFLFQGFDEQSDEQEEDDDDDYDAYQNGD